MNCGRRTICWKTYSYNSGLIIIGFLLGVAMNYYGLLFENIHLVVDVKHNAIVEIERQVKPTESNLSNSTDSEYTVPNIIHYIWFSLKPGVELSFLNYLSISSAYKIHKPNKLILHCDYLPAGSWWDKLWKEVPLQIVHKKPPETIHGQRLLHLYHRGDIAKIEILLEYGGIYLDYDVLVVNSLTPLRKFDATLGKEKSTKLIAGIIVSKQNSLFMRLLYESYKNNYRPLDWDYNCARVAYKIYEQRPDLLHVEPRRLTTPDWKDRHLLYNEIIDWSDLFVIHVMGHFNWEDYNPENIKTMNSTLGEVMRYIYYGSSKLIR